MNSLNYTLLSLTLLLFSCNNSTNSSTNSNESSDTLTTQHNKGGLMLDSSIVNQIKNFYYQFHLKFKYHEIKKSEEVNKNSIAISYEGKYEKSSDDWTPLSEIYIPLINNPNSQELEPNAFVYGDLNGDGHDDCFVRTDIEGAGCAANISWADYFIFIFNNGKYILKHISSGDIDDKELSKVYPNIYSNEHIGHFGPNRIENGEIIGLGLEHSDEDPIVSPSITYEYRFTFNGNKLVQKSRIKI